MERRVSVSPDYAEGQSIVVEYRYAEDRPERLCWSPSW